MQATAAQPLLCSSSPLRLILLYIFPQTNKQLPSMVFKIYNNKKVLGGNVTIQAKAVLGNTPKNKNKKQKNKIHTRTHLQELISLLELATMWTWKSTRRSLAFGCLFPVCLVLAAAILLTSVLFSNLMIIALLPPGMCPPY